MSDVVLVAGIGNIFFRDDGFGVEVAARLAGRTLPPGARVGDFGIRGVHLAYELLDGYAGLVLIDAVPMGEAPGTLAVIEPEALRSRLDDDERMVDAHSMSPDVVLDMLAGLGGTVDPIRVIGCQPASLEEGIGLSPPVAAAVDRAIDLCLEVVSEITAPAGKASKR